MTKNLVFEDVPIGGLFVTGPADTLFIKIDNGEAGVCVGGYAFKIADGRKSWVPGCRIIREATMMDFVQAGKEYDWDKICKQSTVYA